MLIRNISNVKHDYANIVIFDMIYVSIMTYRRLILDSWYNGYVNIQVEAHVDQKHL